MTSPRSKGPKPKKSKGEVPPGEVPPGEVLPDEQSQGDVLPGELRMELWPGDTMVVHGRNLTPGSMVTIHANLLTPEGPRPGVPMEFRVAADGTFDTQGTSSCAQLHGERWATGTGRSGELVESNHVTCQ